MSSAPRSIKSSGPKPVFYYGTAGTAGTPGTADAGIWEKYKVWIIVGASITISVGIYFWMKSKQDEVERESKRKRLEDRMRGEEYAERRAEQLAHVIVRKQLENGLKQKGVRHDLGDPGIQSDLGSTHDWETNPPQKASPQGIAKTTNINQVVAPISQPFHPDDVESEIFEVLEDDDEDVVD